VNTCHPLLNYVYFVAQNDYSEKQKWVFLQAALTARMPWGRTDGEIEISNYSLLSLLSRLDGIILLKGTQELYLLNFCKKEGA
jgi:hypothetical protein